MTDAEAPESDAETEAGFDSDGFWKDLIRDFFPYLLKRAIPELYEKADLTQKTRFLDKEFRDILNTGKRKFHKSPHFADYLLEAPLKTKEETHIILHAEAQGRGGGNIAARMNDYRCFIVAHYNEEPVALAIITKGHVKEERFYSHSHFGTQVTYEYNNLVLADLDDQELLASDNLIDLVLYAAKRAQEAKGEELQKYNYLRTLLGLLSERGWDREDKRNLLLFLERIMDLKDEELEKQYTEYRSQLNKEGKIVYIPLGERELAKELKQSGIDEKAEAVVRKLLIRGDSPESISEVVEWPVERIRSIAY